jgi:hypothetical protein
MPVLVLMQVNNGSADPSRLADRGFEQAALFDLGSTTRW